MKLLPSISSQSYHPLAGNPDGSSKSALLGVGSHTILDRKPQEEKCKAAIPILPNLLSPGCLSNLHEVARRMIFSGHAQECLSAYRGVRSSILEHMVRKLGVENLGRDDVQKVSSEAMEVKVADWPKYLQISIRLLFAGERKLCDQIFYRLDPHRNQCFVNVVENIMSALLNFSDAVIKSKKHYEKLFPILDMYRAMHDILPEVNEMFQANEGAVVRKRFEGTLHRLAQTARETFHDFEQTILKEGPSKAIMQDGMVHPLTTHVVNHVKLLADYQVILQHLLSKEGDTQKGSIILANTSARILTTLLSSLDAKSKQYKYSALGQLFLMNNVQYIIRTVQRCDAKFLLGEDWLQRYQSMVQLHATGYQHAAWDKVLQCLSMEGLVNGGHQSTGNGVPRALLKERFKVFNQTVEELHQCQAQWTVPDSQLKKALQKAVVESVVPAYGYFLQRFSGSMEDGKNFRKYVKYTVEELEHLLADFFEGKMVN